MLQIRQGEGEEVVWRVMRGRGVRMKGSKGEGKFQGELKSKSDEGKVRVMEAGVRVLYKC